MSMFGTTQGSFQNPVDHKPIVAPVPSGATPPLGVVTKPEKTQTIKPSSVKIK